MWGVFKLFDAYTIKARIIPALIAGLPTLAVPFIVVPWNEFGLSNIIVTTISFILLYAFSNVARRSGLRAERKLGTRSTPELWHQSNLEIPNLAKQRFKDFLANELDHPAPTTEDEVADPIRANDFYATAAGWLRDRTRDKKKFDILFEDLMSYGFWRNLYGLRWPTVIMNALVLGFCVWVLWVRPAYFNSLINMDVKMVSVIVGVVLHSLFMLIAVRADNVRGASLSYGKQLILSCETLMQKPTTTASKRSAKTRAAKSSSDA